MIIHYVNRNDESLCGRAGSNESTTYKLDKVNCKICISIIELVAEGKNCEMCGKPIRMITPPAKGICSQNCLSIRNESDA